MFLSMSGPAEKASKALMVRHCLYIRSVFTGMIKTEEEEEEEELFLFVGEEVCWIPSRATIPGCVFLPEVEDGVGEVSASHHGAADE